MLDFMLKSMPLSGMILNVTPNFTELWWLESNFPYNKKVRPKEFQVGDLVWEAVLPLGTKDRK